MLKNIIFTCALFYLIIGCSKNNPVSNTQNTLTGTWTFQYENQSPELNFNYGIMTFYENYKYVALLIFKNNDTITHTGKYNTNLNIITFIDDSNNVNTSGTYYISNDSATFTFPNSSIGNYTQVLIRR